VESVRTGVGPASPAEAEWLASDQGWRHGWRRLAFHAVLLVYLIYVARAIDQYSQGAEAVIGYALLGLFAIGFLVIMPDLESCPSRRFWVLYGVLFALFVVQLPLARAEAFTLAGYLTIVTVRRLDTRSIPIVAGFTIGAMLLPVVVPAWHDGITTGFQNATAVAIPITALATYTVQRIRNGNLALAEAHAEVARLAAENERSRIARDLHDLLGHSLTTITVKTGLARRLGETDTDRALAEITEVETLARRALADVRAAVSNYRDVTLAGELATGRELLRAAGILAELPSAVDGVSPEHQELFGWVVREGLTNVVRHAHASRCAVRLSDGFVEIVDDGVGGNTAGGTGLSGLRERVSAAGGAVDVGPVQPKGWRLRVSLAPQGAIP
jgi:two-component system, NarL family, sensor histidine kinase DesK